MLIRSNFMAIQWSGLGPELLLQLDRQRGQPLRSQLEAGLRDAIRSGRLRGGERLPSSRELARELGVSRGLVQECYNQLLAEGYLTSRVGSATRVAAGARPAPPAPPPGPVPPPRLIADFRSGVPDLASFPREDWTWATREACLRVATPDLDYGDPRGSAVLRQVVAAYLRRVRAAAADHERIVVCTGFAQGLNLVLRALSQLGVRRAALEDPGYGDLAVSDSARAARAVGVDVVPVPVDESGLDVTALEASGARAVVVTPAHQSPTGVVLAAEKRVSDRGSSGLDQLAVAALLESGRYDRHLRRMRAVYARRRGVLIDSLARHAPGIRLTGLAAGFHAVAHLPHSADEQAVVIAARHRSIGLYGMAPQQAMPAAAPPQLVLGFGNLSERAIESGITAVADLLH